MKNLLSSSAFLVVNKSLAKQIGLKESVLLADLISKEEYFIANGMTDGWFFNTEANIEQDTTLTPYQLRKCIKSLKKFGIIETKRRGVPAKQYFKINEEQVVKFLNNLSSSKCTTINKNKEIIINNNISYTKRLENFYNEVFSLDYPKEMLQDFYDYWSEPSKNGKLRKEMQKTWSIKLRLKTWERNSKRFGKPQTMSKLDSQINQWQQAKKLL